MKKSQFVRDNFDIETRLIDNLIENDDYRRPKGGLPNLTQDEIDSFNKYQKQRAALAYQSHKSALSGLFGPEAQADAEALEKSGNAPKNPNKKKKKNKAGSNRVPKSTLGTSGTSTPKAGSSRAPVPQGGTTPRVPAPVNPQGRTTPTGTQPSSGTKPASMFHRSNTLTATPDDSAKPRSSSLTRDPGNVGKSFDSKQMRSVFTKGVDFAQRRVARYAGPLIVGAEVGSFFANWAGYVSGIATVDGYPAPCSQQSYNPYSDPVMDIDLDNPESQFGFNWHVKSDAIQELAKIDFKLTSNGPSFTKRLQQLIYTSLPILLGTAISAAAVATTIGLFVSSSSVAAGPGLPVLLVAGILQAGAAWAVSLAIKWLLNRYDNWGETASDMCATILMETMATRENIQGLCATMNTDSSVNEAAQGGEDEYRDEDPDDDFPTGGVSDESVRIIGNEFKLVLQDMKNEIADDPQKLAEFRELLTKAKAQAKKSLA